MEKPLSVPRKARNWKAPVAVLLVGVLLLVVGLWIFDSMGASALNRAVREMQAMGGPLTLEDLFHARQTLPDEKNGANIILAIKPKFDQAAAGGQDWTKGVPLMDSSEQPLEPGRRWSPEAQKRAEEFLAGFTQELDALDGLKNLEGGYFPIQLAENPVNILLPNLAPLRNCARLKQLQTVERAMRGETQELVSDLDVLLTHSRLLDQDPTLISALVARACDRIAYRTLERVLGLAEISPEELKKIQELLVDRDVEADIKWSIRCERAFFIASADYFRKTGNLGDGMPSGFTGFSTLARMPGAQGWIMKGEAHGITHFNRLLQAPGALGVLKEAREIEKEVGKAGRLDVLTQMLFPSLSRAFGMLLQAHADRLCVRTALAAERYRLATGQWPTGLDQLVPQYISAVPEDPCAPGQLLRLKREQDRLLIYSIGMDGADDGGRLLRDNNESRSPDCGFVLLDPAARNQPPLPESRPEEPTASEPG